MKISRVLPACLVVAAVVLVARQAGTVMDTKSSARNRAIDRLRSDVEALRMTGEGLARSGKSADQALTILRRDCPAVVTGEVSGDQLSWDGVFTAVGSDGGGLTFEQAALRACVRYTTSTGATADVTWTAIDCPAAIANEQRFGPYDETIRLTPPR